MNDQGSGQQASADSGQASGQVNDPGNNNQAIAGPATPLSVQLDQLQVQSLPAIGDQGDKSQGQNDGGQDDGTQGDKSQGQSDSGSGNGQADQQGGDQADNGSQGDGQSGQGDGSNNGLPADGSDPGNGASDSSSQAGQDQTNGQTSQGDTSPPADGSDPGNAAADAYSGSQDGQNDSTNNQAAGQGDNPPSQLNPNQAAKPNDGPAAIPGSRSNTDPAGVLTNGTDNATGMGTGDGTNATANGQGTAPDKKQNGQSSGSLPDGQQHGLAAASDGKPHGLDGALVSGEEPHNLVSVALQAPEQNNRTQLVVQGQQPNGPLDDLAPRQVEERVLPAEFFRKSAIAEVLSTPAVEVLTPVRAFSEDMVPDNDQPNVSPQHHGLLTDSLSLDFYSLRSEVQSFFDQIENLGGHPTERQIGMMLSSGAVVVAAAMACEVARRQARRPAPGSPFALVCKRKFGSGAQELSGIGLPNFGQFSACS